MAEADLSKIVNIIMENPKLVEQIRELVTKSESDTEPKTEAAPPAEEIESESTESVIAASPSVAEENTYHRSHSSRRNDLLRAMRPYVSEERGRAIESMITIADILFTIREK